MFEIHNLLPAIINLAKEYLGVKRISLMLIEDGHLRIYAHAGFDIDPDNIDIKLGQGISGRVAKTGVEVVANKSETIDEDFGYKAKSFMSVPLKANEKVLGVLNLTDKEQDFFTDDDVKIARYIASQCALGVERFRLYNDKRKNESLRIIGLLNSSIAHDIKNLLGIVQSYLELINLEEELDPEVRSYVDSIYTEIKRLHGLTLDLLEFSRQRVTVNISKFKLLDLIEDVRRHITIMTRDTSIEVKYDVSDNVFVKLDREKLFRVLFNLVSNAVDALGDSGEISIFAAVEGERCCFIIRDDGPGIPPESINRIFDPFYTSGKVKGTGLGLAIVKMILEAHGGEIDVKSETGEFTEFRLDLPISYEPA